MNQAPTDRLIARVEKSGREEYRVSIRTRNGNRHVDLRIFADNGVERAATPKGLAIKPTSLQLLIEALRRAQAAVADEGLIPPPRR